MTLEEKGNIVPPPVLAGHSQQVSKAIQGWEKIIAATHWEIHDNNKPNGADFYIGEHELGHIHLDGEVHLATGSQLQAVLLKHKLADKFPYGSGWVAYDIDSAESAKHALWLFKLNYSRIMGADAKALAEEVSAYAGTARS